MSLNQHRVCWFWPGSATLGQGLQVCHLTCRNLETEPHLSLFAGVKYHQISSTLILYHCVPHTTYHLLQGPVPSRMSSPPFTFTSPSQGRKIALPRRPRARSGSSSTPRTPSSSENLLSTDGTPSPSSTVSSISHLGGTYQTPESTFNARHLSPPPSGVPRIAFQFGQQGSTSLPGERQEAFTLRILHNTTPRSSLAPEEIALPASRNSLVGLNYSSLPERATPDNEISQPAHTIYSDEKIAIPDVSNSTERSIPTIVGDHSEATAATPHASSTRLQNLLRHNQSSDLSPSRSILRERSFSDASDISDIYENNDSANFYDVRDEEAPIEPFFTPTFQTALQNGLGIANKVVSAIEKLVGSSAPSSDLERLSRDAKLLGAFYGSDTRTIAVLGDSGEGNCNLWRGVNAIADIRTGKSSLINSLLHFPEIAKTVGS